MERIAIFPGSFDPFTNAHLAIVQRSLKLFDQVRIAIGVNTTKKGLFSFEKREMMIQESIGIFGGRVQVDFFEGLTVTYAKKVGAQFILRSMRSAQDFEFERAIAQNNIGLDPSLETVFLLSEGHLSHISSTIVREIILNGGDVHSLVPQPVLAVIKTGKFDQD